ncbi:MAG: hypothetical protein P8N76_29200 [Pirellulaceae bacterium]|nr:hypothetical protein [Pirellulaceae bacterium]
MKHTRSLTLLLFAWIVSNTGCAPSAVAPSPDAPLAVGETMPPILPEGWLNGPGPSSADLKNKVVVIDIWAYW